MSSTRWTSASWWGAARARQAPATRWQERPHRVEPFTLTRGETATLIERLAAAGVGDADICRFTGVSSP